ncbi:hypothetical protein FA13DRAFT_1791792 [Coprinellus micaceus]|uniref:Uncharacterized protein n=1 Tax=Coprinellus micaceus TaxID=71717 RepID=A0A4Y7TA88_COPMI|nr:hypothetical protein FA13DRAFT_1791792 [Coprinellus micaceus]
MSSRYPLCNRDRLIPSQDPGNVAANAGESFVAPSGSVPVGMAPGDSQQTLLSDTSTPGMFDEPPPAQRAGGEAMPSPDRPAEEDRTPASHGVGSDDTGTGIARMPEPATHMGPNSTRRGRTTVSEELEGFLSDSSFNNLNRVQKHRVHRREEAQRRPRSPSTSSRGEGPSNKTKGKGPDPGDWGIDTSESEIELQKAAMESLAKQKDNHVIFEDGIDTSANAIMPTARLTLQSPLLDMFLLRGVRDY